jgi:hypothetical protein
MVLIQGSRHTKPIGRFEARFSPIRFLLTGAAHAPYLPGNVSAPRHQAKNALYYHVLIRGVLANSFAEARKRQLARLDGAKPKTARAAMALAKSQAYQDAADAPSTLRAYTADLGNYKDWCERHGFVPNAGHAGGWRVFGGSWRRLRPSDPPPSRCSDRASLRRLRASFGYQAPLHQGDAPRDRPKAWSASPSIRRSNHGGGEEIEPSLWHRPRRRA